MALTNGTTLWNKIKSIADAIRGKTDKTDTLTIDQMVQEINNNWHAFVKEFELRGAFDKVYGDNLQTIIYSYTPDGNLVLSVQTKNSDWEAVWWCLRNAPSGVSMIVGRQPDNTTPSGEPQQIISCIITGISQNCKVVVEQGDTDSFRDRVQINVDVEYI